ncbi:hypothetical protein [Arthrobacter cheniae]|nr:hypothetical protein [Arthrobacter cheniae]
MTHATVLRFPSDGRRPHRHLGPVRLSEDFGAPSRLQGRLHGRLRGR